MFRGTWLPQSAEHGALDLGVVEFEPHVGSRVYFLKKAKTECSGCYKMRGLEDP